MSLDNHAPRPGGPGTPHGMLTVEDLEEAVGNGMIDTVVAAFTDTGRRMGKYERTRMFERG